MIAIQIKRAIVVLFVLASGISLAIAQDNPPVVESEEIGATMFQARPERVIGSISEIELATPIGPSALSMVSQTAATLDGNSTRMAQPISVDPPVQYGTWEPILKDQPIFHGTPARNIASANPMSAIFGTTISEGWARSTADWRTRVPPQLMIPAKGLNHRLADVACVPPSEPGLAATAEAPMVVANQPAALSVTDSEMFAPSSGSGHNKGNDSMLQRAESDEPRMPRMTKMFSFDTTDKVASSKVARALGQFNPELTLDLAGPELVAVNQVFQQLVQVRNSSGMPIHDVRVTQVCDLAVLGADRHQAVVIDCLEPGETKTVRFSAQARQAGSFAVRYIAANSRIQADVDELVQVSDTGISNASPQPTRR